MVCKYNLIRTSIDDKWDNFIKKSPSGTMYSSSLYLKVFNVDAYYCYKQNELMAAVLCLTSKDGKSIVGNDLVIYDGLIYRDLSHLNISQKNSEEFKIQEYVANEIFNIYEKVSFKMHPSIVDIRPFLWKNYHSSDDGYLLDLHYTCYIDISDFSQNKSLNELKIYKNASSARRQEIRYAIKKNVKTTLSTDVYMFINFFQMTFDRQDINLDKVFLRDMLIIIKNLIENNACILLQSATDSGRVGSMAVFLLGHNTAYYLFGANDPDMRNQHTGTAVIWDSFHILSEMNINTVDLEGINSPNRGWFKTSFGGRIIPYYKITKS